MKNAQIVEEPKSGVETRREPDWGDDDTYHTTLRVKRRPTPERLSRRVRRGEWLAVERERSGGRRG
jgi:hypothetical protein